MPQDDDGAAVPIRPTARLLGFGVTSLGIAVNVAAGGPRALASGRRPDLAQLLLTSANTLRSAGGLSHLHGAARKSRQILSIGIGLVLPAAFKATLGRLHDDIRQVLPEQLQTVLNAEWGAGWDGRFARFDVRLFEAASIGQVGRADTRADDPASLARSAATAGATQTAIPDIAQGPLCDWLDQAAHSLANAGITFCEWRRNWNAAIWPQATAGFLKFKQNIAPIFDRMRPA